MFYREIWEQMFYREVATGLNSDWSFSTTFNQWEYTNGYLPQLSTKGSMICAWSMIGHLA